MQKTLKAFILPALLSIFSMGLLSCEDFIEEQGDCTTKYRIRFVYDMNLKWADAFASEVKSVNLYIFDEDGLFVKEYDAAGDELSKPDFCIEFDENTIPPGNYTMVAWCGLVNNGVAMESFTVPQPQPGVTTLEELTCTLNTQTTKAMEFSDKQLKFMYHGMINVDLPDVNDGNTYDYTIYLTKDTNHIRIILQELSGDDMKAGDYDISIEAADGRLAYNNTLLPDNPPILYTPWAQLTDQMTISDNGIIKYNQGLIADLSTSRMMASHEDEFYLTITSHETQEKIIARIPVIQYALLAKEYYVSAYGHNMTDQEFLDREDEYVLTFFLYQNRWLGTEIMINSWRVVLHDYDLNN